MLAVLLALPAPAAEVLPVRRVRFYETGVGWFERQGTVRDRTSLPVPTSHLDDALKTLVVLGGDADVGAITFPSALGADAARVAAGLTDDGPFGFEEALRALRGVRVTLETDDRPLTGVLLEVDGPLPVPTPDPDAPPVAVASEYALTVLGADGTLQRTTTQRVRSVRTEEPDAGVRLGAAARAATPTHAQRPNALSVDVASGGSVGLGYLAETPVWRVSYRILADEGRNAELQAWGLVHNDTDEDWRGVTVELANGEPDSFLYPLAAPRYAARELVTPDRDLGTVAQLAATTADALWNAASGGISASGMGMAGYGLRGGGSAFGVGGIGVVGQAAARLKQAEPVQTPTQFVYRVARPVDLPAHHSGLVPLVHGDVPAEAAVVFAPNARAGRNGVWLTNRTDRTLPAGVVSVLAAGGLAGETSLERLKPEEQQMLLFGNELDVDLSWTVREAPVTPTRLRVDGPVVVVTETRSTSTELDVRNRSGRARTLWVGLALPPEADVVGTTRTEIDPHRGWTYTLIDAPAGQSAPVVTSASSTDRRVRPMDVGAPEWLAWADRSLADPGTLRAAADVRGAWERIGDEIRALEGERARADAELEGLRTSLRAAEGSDGTAALTRRAASVDGEIRRLDARLSEAQGRRSAQEARLEALIASLGPDASADVTP